MKERQEIFRGSVDTVGSAALVNLQGIRTAAVLCAPKRPESLANLIETYERIWSAQLTRVPLSVYWDGVKIRIVLSRRTGELWDLCMGFEGPVNRYLQTGSVLMHQVGGSELWNYWNLRLTDDYVARWKAQAEQRELIYFTVMTSMPTGGPVTKLDTMIPIENLMVRE